ncbi:MAG: tetratricopeptide repeat protein, partial [Ignavibacteriales bacterium]|nr:tetratricopeptide repeat protein [Ignavibacteriales bacterium]
YFFIFLFLIGCGTSQPPMQQPAQPNQQEKKTIARERNKEAALKHFIAGSTYDAKNDYARAALEYQEALRFDDDPAIFYALSRDYIQLNKLDLAEQFAREAVYNDTTNRDFRENLATIHLMQFHIDSAVVQFNEIIRNDSDYIKAWFDVAHATQYKSPSAAIALYKALISRFGSNLDAWEQIAQLSLQTKQFEEAASAYNEMLLLEPSNVQVEMALAAMYELTGKDSLALLHYQKVANETDNIDTKIAAARLFLLQHKFDEAEKIIGALVDGDSAAFETKIKVGEAYVDALQRDSTLGEYVRSFFLKLKDEEPNDWRPYWFLAAIAASEEKYAEAITQYEKIIELDETNIEGWVNLATMYSEQKQFTEMATVLERARKIIPNDVRINFFLGIAYYRDGKLTESVDPLERTLQQRPNDFNTLSTLALVYDALKRYAESDRLYEEALRVDPENHLILNNYGYSLSARGEQLPRAKEMAEKALAKQPKNTSYLDTMGWVHFKLGNYSDAKNFIQQAIEGGDASAEVNEHMGDVFYKLNEVQNAMEYWRKAVEKDGKRESAKEKLRKGGM